MRLDEQVESWVEWSRRNLPQTGNIPKLDCRMPLPPWVEDFPGTLETATGAWEQLLVRFAERLIADPADIPSRYTALRLYSSLSGLFVADESCRCDVSDFISSEKGLDPAELEILRNPDNGQMLELTGWFPAKASELMDSFKNDLCLLVRQLKVEEVPSDWRFVRWEILNSYAIRDWDRARKLITKAEEEALLEPQEIHALRGHFLYLIVFGPRMGVGLETLYWEPAGSQESLPQIMTSAFAELENKEPLTDEERHTVREAALYLERCVGEESELSVLFGVLLALCYFEIGHLHEAAAQFERFLGSELSSFAPQEKVEVYKELSATYEKIGDEEKAMECLASCATEFAKEPGINRNLAEMFADRGNYRSAYGCLLKETEVTPGLEKDLGVRVALALGALQDASNP